jgi:hypothetical protein
MYYNITHTLSEKLNDILTVCPMCLTTRTDQNSMQRSLMWCRRDLAMFVKMHVQPSHHDRIIEQLERQDERYALI